MTFTPFGYVVDLEGLCGHLVVGQEVIASCARDDYWWLGVGTQRSNKENGGMKILKVM